MMLSGAVVPFTRFTVVVESCREKIKCTFVPDPGIAHPGNVPGGLSCLHGPACIAVGAFAIVIENFDEKPVITVGFVIAFADSSDDNRVTLISGPPTTPTVWRQTRLPGGELLAGDFQ